jgi:hypothetical protein
MLLHLSSPLLRTHSTEIDPLAPFPSLNTNKEDARQNEHDAPLPVDGRMLEHNRVQHRDIDERKQRNKPHHDSPEQELVPPHIDRPLREVALTTGLHAEKGASHIDHFPGQEEGKP